MRRRATASAGLLALAALSLRGADRVAAGMPFDDGLPVGKHGIGDRPARAHPDETMLEFRKRYL